MRLADLCSVPDCIYVAQPGTFRCSKHREEVSTERQYDYDLTCLACGRTRTDTDGTLKMTEAAAFKLKPERCSVCGGRMLLTRADVGHLGSSIDPRVPTRLDTRPGYKARQSA